MTHTAEYHHELMEGASEQPQTALMHTIEKGLLINNNNMYPSSQIIMI